MKGVIIIARNKYPEQTVERILTVSAKLFAQKGYEKTTMQDILDELKLSKGAIYHHFKSKEEILKMVIEHWSSQEETLIRELSNHGKGDNGKEKITNLLMDFLTGLGDLYKTDADELILGQSSDPYLVMTGVRSLVNEFAPAMSKLLEEGVKDGSLQTDYPLETAEIFMLLFGLWTKPSVFERSEAQTMRRLEVLRITFRQLGVDVITDALIEKMLAEYRRMLFFKNL